MNFEYPYYSVSRIKDFFKESDAMPRKKWGQNFLIDPNTIQFIWNQIPTELGSNTKHFLEIGPGLGALTYRIFEAEKKVSVFEIDRVLIQNLKNLELPIHKIYEGDVLETILQIEKEEYILVGNLPYYISTDIILTCLKNIPELKFAVFMLQKEFAERICKEISSISMYVLAFGKFKYLKTISANCFFPKPDASSALVSFTPNEKKYSNEKIAKYELFLKSIFWGKRKTIFKSISDSPFLDVEIRTYLLDFLNEEKNLLNKRPEELDVEVYLKILESI